MLTTPSPHAAPDDVALPGGVRRSVTDAGIVSLWSPDAPTSAFVAAFAETARSAPTAPFALALVWFSSARHDGTALAPALREAAPGLETVGCSTAGELTPDGLQEAGALAVFLPASRFEASVALLPRMDRLGMEEIVRRAATARREIRAGAGETFALALMDGMTFAEEATTAALQRGLDDVALVGGSAGDGMRFATTQQLFRGRVHDRSAVLAIVRTSLPFRTFSYNNFVPTETRLVVTGADVGRRTVHELDAEPALDAYAAALGMDPEAVDVSTFATRPLVLRIGGEHYCRSVRRVNDDGSLSLFCAIDTGLVLTLARSEGMVRSATEALDRLEAELGGLDCAIGFDCVHRRLDAETRGATGRMAALLQARRVVGFNSYGEQYRSMHLNQTFTGVAFGPAAT